MVHYDLTHLTQDTSQRVLGPIQDDEALFMFSIINGMRLSRILEIGGGNGYSGRNFLQAMQHVPGGGILYTVDINPVPQLAANHKVLTKNALHLTGEDVDNEPLDFVFFDCHDMVQMDIFKYFVEHNIINEKTVLALHDTNLHYSPYNVWGPYVEEEGGFAHQPVERIMVNTFKSIGYDVFSLHTTREKHSDAFPFRHGITICQRFRPLKV